MMLAELHLNFVEFLVGFRTWLDSRFKAVFEQRGNRSEQFTGARSPLFGPFFINHGARNSNIYGPHAGVSTRRFQAIDVEAAVKVGQRRGCPTPIGFGHESVRSLRLIADRVRRRFLVVEHRAEIAHNESTATRFAFVKMLGLAQ
jgi:hypothetical protein